METDKKLKIVLQSEGYRDLVKIEKLWCGIRPFLFTWGVCYGLDRFGYQGRFCFGDLTSARKFLDQWDGETPPVVGEDGCTAIK